MALGSMLLTTDVNSNYYERSGPFCLEDNSDFDNKSL